MIFVTSGFEKGIGLEVFFKALVNTRNLPADNYHLITSKEHVLDTISQCQLDIKILEKSLVFPETKIQITYISSVEKSPLTTRSLEVALSLIQNDDTLLTLPTKKDQLILNGNIKAGYTEYFRSKFNDSNLTMNFLSKTDNVMLLTDHIPLSKIESTITEELISQKIETTLSMFPKSRKIEEVYFSGINPHCGEEGLMGSADQIISDAVLKLTSVYPGIVFHAPRAGDTLYFNHKNNSQLFVFAFHDQGLAPFKLKNGLIGINLTLGLPFKRVSVDHGTAPDIFGKNCADYDGMGYLIHEIQSW